MKYIIFASLFLVTFYFVRNHLVKEELRWPTETIQKIKYGDISDLKLKKLIKLNLTNQPELLQAPINNGTIIEYLVISGYPESLEYVIKLGGDIKKNYDNGETLLFWRTKPIELIEVLLSHGIDVNHQDNKGNTVLHNAIYDGLPSPKTSC